MPHSRPQHARHHGTRAQVVVALLAHLVAAIVQPAQGQHALKPIDPNAGANPGYAKWLHVENTKPGVRDEARA